jgi:hypothetical protein
MLRFEFEEYRPARPFWGWVIVITASVLTLSWGMVSHMAVPEVVRQWDFGAVRMRRGKPPDSSAADARLPAD